ncbi:MAG: hypothetical protein DMD52_08855 [Gemmatimonadetes bacterium]|nr:MAG: hypothetical protein DMD52_08855 [Gemmatimonadota bacterium]
MRVGAFVERHDLGHVFAQDTGFKIERDPDTVRAPDVAFVAREGLVHIPQEGYAELAPDWVAEILSPSDSPGEVLEKVGQWLSAGVRVVWLLDQVRRDARIYRADGTDRAVPELHRPLCRSSRRASSTLALGRGAAARRRSRNRGRVARRTRPARSKRTRRSSAATPSRRPPPTPSRPATASSRSKMRNRTGASLAAPPR